MFSDKLTVHYPLLDIGQTTLWIDQLVNKGEHLAAIKPRYFPLEMVETKTEHKRKWILDCLRFTIKTMHVKIHSCIQIVSRMLSSPEQHASLTNWNLWQANSGQQAPLWTVQGISLFNAPLSWFLVWNYKWNSLHKGLQSLCTSKPV